LTVSAPIGQNGRIMRLRSLALLAFVLLLVHGPALAAPRSNLDATLRQALTDRGFTGTVGQSLEQRLGRALEPALADLGRVLWFDKITGLHSDNTCGGCHSPSTGFGDTQSIAIGIQSNNVVGGHRSGPRNQRRTPSVINTAFFPALMWNGRFSAPSGDPFDNTQGYFFPAPEGATKFPVADPIVTHLLIAQAHIPPTELVEVAGFTGTAGTIGGDFDAFDDALGSVVPPPDVTGFRNDPIRDAVLARLNASAEYRSRFGALFPSVANGGPIDFLMFARAIAEFEFTLVFADAPLDRFARGEARAMTAAEKRGAIVFFGKGRCVDCHAVAGAANEMFSDFQNHVVGVPQIAPVFGVGTGNVIFDGPGKDEDFGLEQVSGNPLDRYKFRTAPLRNLALQPAFFHNGAFTRLRDAVEFHLDPVRTAPAYDARRAGVDKDLRVRLGPIQPVLDRLDPSLGTPIGLTTRERQDLLKFLHDGLLDERAKRPALCALVPRTVPSGIATLRFERCQIPR
jgi:cytochrome c peroxidase